MPSEKVQAQGAKSKKLSSFGTAADCCSHALGQFDLKVQEL